MSCDNCLLSIVCGCRTFSVNNSEDHKVACVVLLLLVTCPHCLLSQGGFLPSMPSRGQWDPAVD